WIDWATWANWLPGTNGTNWIDWATGATWATGANWFLPVWTDPGVTPYRNWSVWKVDSTNIYNLWSNVGIGMVPTSQKLEVNGNIKLNNAWYIASSINTNQVFLALNGNVGIGTATPTDNKLQIAGNITSLGFISRWDLVAAWASSVAMGFNTNAIWPSSTAMGFQTSANKYSTAIGYGSHANWEGSTAMGYSTNANGDYSTTMGYSTTANVTGTTAMGYWTTANGKTGSTAVGAWNLGLPTSIFEIWIGASFFSKANAMTVLNDWKVGIGTSTPNCNGFDPGACKLHVNGDSYFDSDMSVMNGDMWVGYNVNASSSSGNLFILNKVGIGTNIPAEKLEVIGTIKATTSVKIGTITLPTTPWWTICPNVWEIKYIQFTSGGEIFGHFFGCIYNGITAESYRTQFDN
ncbi:MAG: hypothetical protein ACD_80C00107G0001, partial [uncultured bacterium (gcode 4)]